MCWESHSAAGGLARQRLSAWFYSDHLTVYFKEFPGRTPKWAVSAVVTRSPWITCRVVRTWALNGGRCIHFILDPAGVGPLKAILSTTSVSGIQGFAAYDRSRAHKPDPL